MDGFSDIKLSWKGDPYTVPADRAFELVRRLEGIIMNNGSVPAFVLLLQNRVPQSTLAMAYADALQFAGAKVTAQEVYLNIMQDFAKDSSEAARKVQDAIIGLLAIISPPIAHEIMGELDEGKD